MNQIERRRADTGDLPTALETSFEEMSKSQKKKLQSLGFVMIIFSVALPMVAGIFVELGAAYWLFSGVVFVVGLLFLWPRAGVYILSSAPGAIAKIIPSSKVKEMLSPVERRARETVEEVAPDQPDVEEK